MFFFLFFFLFCFFSFQVTLRWPSCDIAVVFDAAAFFEDDDFDDDDEANDNDLLSLSTLSLSWSENAADDASARAFAAA